MTSTYNVIALTNITVFIFICVNGFSNVAYPAILDDKEKYNYTNR